MLFNSPLSFQKADQLIDVLDCSAVDRLLDVGCGTGEFLVRLVDASGASGLGVDINPELISQAQQKAAERLAAHASLEFHKADIAEESLAEDSFDVAICIGSTHAFGMGDEAYPKTLDQLARLVKPGGQILIGEGYWKQPPAQGYLDLLGDTPGIYHSHAENVWFAERRGLIPLYTAVSNTDEWDHFEGAHWLKAEREYAADGERLQGIRAWRDGYLRWGRETMGFGFYLFQNRA
ncbi:MAG: SAM-dependent methyltransferase [Cellvibrionaceae bacterium]|jgi:SAM-dependent methyltransferase